MPRRKVWAVNHVKTAPRPSPTLNFLTQTSSSPNNAANPNHNSTSPTFAMPSVKNPNKPSKNRLAARANKVRKRSQKESAAGRVTVGVVKADVKRGARPGLLPTSGPRKPVSAKRQRKLDKKL